MKKVLILVVMLAAAFGMGQEVVRPSATAKVEAGNVVASLFLPMEYANKPVQILATMNCDNGVSLNLAPTGENHWSELLEVDENGTVTYIWGGDTPIYANACIMQLRYDHTPKFEKWVWTSLFEVGLLAADNSDLIDEELFNQPGTLISPTEELFGAYM